MLEELSVPQHASGPSGALLAVGTSDLMVTRTLRNCYLYTENKNY